MQHHSDQGRTFVAAIEGNDSGERRSSDQQAWFGDCTEQAAGRSCALGVTRSAMEAQEQQLDECASSL
jgi:hypothetical protein